MELFGPFVRCGPDQKEADEETCLSSRYSPEGAFCYDRLVRCQAPRSIVNSYPLEGGPWAVQWRRLSDVLVTTTYSISPVYLVPGHRDGGSGDKEVYLLGYLSRLCLLLDTIGTSSRL